jgi:protein-S-isoprenylcysteine O-methyltransferase Ste14
MPVFLEPPPMSPLARFFAAVVAALTVIGAFMLGLVFISVAIGLGLLVAGAAWLRAWWLRRTLGSNRPPGPAPADERGETIEAEYTVITTERSESRTRH